MFFFLSLIHGAQKPESWADQSCQDSYLMAREEFTADPICTEMQELCAVNENLQNALQEALARIDILESEARANAPVPWLVQTQGHTTPTQPKESDEIERLRQQVNDLCKEKEALEVSLENLLHRYGARGCDLAKIAENITNSEALQRFYKEMAQKLKKRAQGCSEDLSSQIRNAFARSKMAKEGLQKAQEAQQKRETDFLSQLTERSRQIRKQERALQEFEERETQHIQKIQALEEELQRIKDAEKRSDAEIRKGYVPESDLKKLQKRIEQENAHQKREQKKLQFRLDQQVQEIQQLKLSVNKGHEYQNKTEVLEEENIKYQAHIQELIGNLMRAKGLLPIDNRTDMVRFLEDVRTRRRDKFDVALAVKTEGAGKGEFDMFMRWNKEDDATEEPERRSIFKLDGVEQVRDRIIISAPIDFAENGAYMEGGEKARELQLIKDPFFGAIFLAAILKKSDIKHFWIKEFLITPDTSNPSNAFMFLDTSGAKKNRGLCQFSREDVEEQLYRAFPELRGKKFLKHIN